MARRPNRKAPEPVDPNHGQPEIELQFLPHEYGGLKFNKANGPGALGGYQQCENMLLELTDPQTLRCPLSPDQNALVQRRCRAVLTDDGGPQKRIRDACIPAYRRLKIELLPEFSSQYVRKVPHDDPRLVVRKNAE
jgi:hypothetical protein